MNIFCIAGGGEGSLSATKNVALAALTAPTTPQVANGGGAGCGGGVITQTRALPSSVPGINGLGTSAGAGLEALANAYTAGIQHFTTGWNTTGGKKK